jgi:hypothetical protein
MWRETRNLKKKKKHLVRRVNVRTSKNILGSIHFYGIHRMGEPPKGNSRKWLKRSAAEEPSPTAPVG